MPTEATALPALLPFHAVAGDDISFTLTCKDEEGSLIDLSDYELGDWYLNVAGTDQDITVDKATNTLELSWTSTQSTALGPGTFHGSGVLIEPGGVERTYFRIRLILDGRA